MLCQLEWTLFCCFYSIVILQKQKSAFFQFKQRPKNFFGSVSSTDSLSTNHCILARWCPPHLGLHVRGFHNETFSNRWIGIYGLIPLPPRSPDITSQDFFLGGYVKNIVCRTKVRDMTDLRQRISTAIATIVEAMLQWTWKKIENRLEVLRATKGAQLPIWKYIKSNNNIFN